MGNQASSCNLGSSCSSRFHAALEPCAVAKVLLLDGEVLHFTKSVKAIHVLLQHPNHCLCPAQALRFMQYSHTDPSPPLPCNLLPDDELELGRIYILLPFHTFRLFVSAAASNNHYNTINRAMIRHSLPLSTQAGHFAPKHLHSFSSRRSSPWINEEEPTSIQAEPTSNQEEPTSIQAQPSSNQEEPATNEAPITTLNHILFCRKSNEEEPISKKPYALPTPNQEKPTSNHALPTPNHLFFSRRNPLWINAEEPTNSIQEQAASMKEQKQALPFSHQAGEPSTNRTFISKPSINTALRKANLSSLPASTASRRSFELQRPRKGAIDIRRCRSWRPRLQAITEMSTW